MIIQNHIENSISMMIIKLDQHSIILKKSWIKKHEMSYHEHDDSILFHFNHCNHLNAFDRSYSNQTQTKKKNFFSKKIFFNQSEIIENKEIKIFFEKTNNSKTILRRSVDLNKRLIERRMNESWRKKLKKSRNVFIKNFEKRIEDKSFLWRSFVEVRRWIFERWIKKCNWNSLNCNRFVQYFISTKRCENIWCLHEESKNSVKKTR
jgi:hypothetical protein